MIKKMADWLNQYGNVTEFLTDIGMFLLKAWLIGCTIIGIVETVKWIIS